MRARFCVLLFLLYVGVAWAGDYVGEDTVTPGKFRRYLDSLDPTQAIPQVNEVLHLVPEADTPAQRVINLGQPHAIPPVPPSVPVKYRKVVGGLVVEMTAGEKQAVDDAKDTADAILAPWRAEIITPEACPFATLVDLNAYFNGQIAALTTAIQATPAGAVRQALTEIATTSITNERRLAKLLCARTKVGR